VIPAFIRGTPPTDQIGASLVTPSCSRVTFGLPIDLSRFNRHDAGDKDVQAEVSCLFRQALLNLRDQGLPAEKEVTTLESQPILRSDTHDAA
jgi:1-acyl-sn-glycerol-3-phosphate acyltransferase